jgi:alkanesulfonate monooxygenase SsuD/methylene tetrahydromethanopterin reductase-like flavin-dependent oxidoreductase (luciferase family)
MAAYHAALLAAGHSAETVRIATEWSATGKAVHVAETDADARAEAEVFFAKNPSGAIARNPDDMICGSPNTVARAMGEFAASGVGVMICGFLIDVEDPLSLQRSLRLFRDEVIPMVSAASERARVT